MVEILHKLFIFIISLLIATLLWLRITNKPIFIDPQFKPHVERFKVLSKSYDIELNTSLIVVKFGFLKDGVAGNCAFGKIITVNTSYWDYMSDDEREILLFHELGHCLLQKRHVEELI